MIEKNDYDIAYAVPKESPSSLSSRTQPNLHSDFFGLYPIMSSPMKWLGNPKFVVAMSEANCIGILHRFDTYENRLDSIRKTAEKTQVFGVAIGVDDILAELNIVKYAADAGAKIIVVDIANGYLSRLENDIFLVKKQTDFKIKVAAGNVITRSGANFLNDAGGDFVRVGIGNGSNCQTRSVTGIGRNQLYALHDCLYSDAFIVSDGGIKEPGDAVKSFVAGADFIMLASALAHAEEAEHDGILYGMASLKNHQLNNKPVKSIEGFETRLEKARKPLKEILDEYLWGIRSACTYAGAWRYIELRERCVLRRKDTDEPLF